MCSKDVCIYAAAGGIELQTDGGARLGLDLGEDDVHLRGREVRAQQPAVARQLGKAAPIHLHSRWLAAGARAVAKQRERAEGRLQLLLLHRVPGRLRAPTALSAEALPKHRASV